MRTVGNDTWKCSLLLVPWSYLLLFLGVEEVGQLSNLLQQHVTAGCKKTWVMPWTPRLLPGFPTSWLVVRLSSPKCQLSWESGHRLQSFRAWLLQRRGRIDTPHLEQLRWPSHGVPTSGSQEAGCRRVQLSCQWKAGQGWGRRWGPSTCPLCSSLELDVISASHCRRRGQILAPSTSKALSFRFKKKKEVIAILVTTCIWPAFSGDNPSFLSYVMLSKLGNFNNVCNLS